MPHKPQKDIISRESEQNIRAEQQSQEEYGARNKLRSPTQGNMSPTEPSPALRTWLHQRQLSGYLRVLATEPWADLEAAYATLNVAEITPEAIRAYLDLPSGGIKEVEMLTHERIAAYYGKYSMTFKTFYRTYILNLNLFS